VQAGSDGELYASTELKTNLMIPCKVLPPDWPLYEKGSQVKNQ
jgi:hypothetical protein